MTKHSPEILTLRSDIEADIGHAVCTPYDFEFLSGMIWERLHENISATTLKRLWGYICGAETTRRTTLSILARFLGYADWNAYLDELNRRSDIESETFSGRGIRTEELLPGNRIEVTWQPNRRCVFRYLGNRRFCVEEAENSKLRAGNTFSAACFLIGKPMFLDCLSYGDTAAVASSYVAGSKRGLSTVNLLSQQE